MWKTNLKLWLVRLVPRSWLYWCVIQAWAYTTTEKHTDLTPGEVSWDMVCDYMSS